MRLNVHRHGVPDGAPLLVVHGLFGSGRNWGAIAKRLAQGGREVICPDMRNHGASPWSAAHGYADLAGDLAELIAAEAGGTADVLGHSMGGKAAMALALLHPGRVRRLIVADIAPVAYGHAAAQLANIAAMRALDLAGVANRAEAGRRLEPAIADPALRAFLLQSLETGAGGARWRLNLEVLAAEMDAIVGWPEVGGRFDGPVLFLSGALSRYVLSEHRAAILARFPAARFVRIAGAGHWLHADRPEAFISTVQTWLDATRGLLPGGQAPAAQGSTSHSPDSA